MARPETTLAIDGPARSLVDGRCPVCRSRVLVQEGADVFVRNAILRVDGSTGGALAKCSRCKCWLTVPLKYTG